MCFCTQAAPGIERFWANTGHADGAMSALPGRLASECQATLSIVRHGSVCTTALCTILCGM